MWHHKPYPLKRVVERLSTETRYNRHGEGSYRDTLECGHVWWGKRSLGTPKRRRCRDCGHLANAGRQVRREEEKVHE